MCVKQCDFLKNIIVPPDCVMASFDVVSLFTSVPRDLAVNTARLKLKEDESLSQRTSLAVDDICDLLSFCLEATDFAFDGSFYKQVFGCAMGSPVSAVVANLVMEDVEDRILADSRFQIMSWKRFVDDTFVILQKHDLKPFFDFINEVEPSIKFTVEVEDECQQLPFLDVLVKRLEGGKLSFGVFRKNTHTHKHLCFSSHHAPSHKRSVVRSLLSRAKTHTSDSAAAEQERRQVRDALRANGYPQHLLKESQPP